MFGLCALVNSKAPSQHLSLDVHLCGHWCVPIDFQPMKFHRQDEGMRWRNDLHVGGAAFFPPPAMQNIKIFQLKAELIKGPA
jgi:hypothetical protein